MSNNKIRTNFLVIGSGIAGLNFALNAAKKGKVTIVTKKKSIDSGTNFAQGGIATVISKTDNFEKHINDTLATGSGRNNKKAVEFMVKKAPKAIQRLMERGVKFANKKGKLLLTREGGHSEKRIVYIGDHTGKEIEKVLSEKVKNHPDIEILEDTFALDLIISEKACYGCLVLHKNKSIPIFADQTILTTGGSGQLYRYTTNPKIATGDGIAMAIRAGAKTKDMEFIQFHPTALAKKISPMFLISETVRGEGGKLVNKQGEKFLKNDLASRDIVAKGIYSELKKGPVFLDISHKKTNYLKKRFPEIYKTLKKYGFNMGQNRIPVTPAAHYQCGGIETDIKGKTNIKNLFAFGEVACTGVHGANRLASNSLLEALVFSDQIAKNLKKIPEETFKKIKIPKIKTNKKIPEESKEVKKLKKEIQNVMWEYAGIVRNHDEINKTAIPKMEKINKKLKKIKSTNPETAEAQNMALTGIQILKAAGKRKRSLGCHFMQAHGTSTQ